MKIPGGAIGSISSLLIARLVSAALQFVTLLFIVNSVSISDYGSYSAALAIGAVVSGVFGFGLITRALRLTAEKNEHLIRPALTITILGALASALVVGGFSLWQGHSGLWVVLAAMTYVGSEMINSVVQSILFGEERSRRAESVVITRRAVPLIAILPTALFMPDRMFLAAAIGFILSSLVAMILVGRRPWNGWHWSGVIGGSRQYWFSNIWSMLQQLDVVIVSTLLGPASAGAYSASFRLASPIHIVTTSIVSVMVPRLSKIEDPKLRRDRGRPFMMAGTAYASVLTLLSPAFLWLGPLLFGEEYAPYAWVFPIFVANSALSVLNQIQAARIYAEGIAKPVTKSIAFCSVAGLVAVALFGLSWGVVAAAAGFASSRALLSILLWIAWRRHTKRMDELH